MWSEGELPPGVLVRIYAFRGILKIPNYSRIRVREKTVGGWGGEGEGPVGGELDTDPKSDELKTSLENAER